MSSRTLEGIGSVAIVSVTIDDAPFTHNLRTEPTLAPGPQGGQIWLRDQLRTRVDPAGSLDGISPEEWWKLLNSRVYFFCRQRDADTLLNSYLRRDLAQEVIKLRTRAVLESLADQVEVTTVNVGVFPRVAGPSRGRGSFHPLRMFPADDAGRIREITVVTGVPVPLAAVATVVRHSPGGGRVRLYP